MSTTLATRTIEYSCQPFAFVDEREDAADLLDEVLSALGADKRALGATCGYDYEIRKVYSTFQVEFHEVYDRGEDALSVATQLARDIFDAALERAGVEQRTAGLAIVEGGDPEYLP